MLRRVAKKLSLGIMRREFEDYVRFLRSGSDNEMAWLLFSACRMRLVLEAAATKLGPFPRDELNGHVLLDSEHRGNLSIYTMKLLQLASHQFGNQSNEGDIAAAGLKAWIFSIRALHAPRLLALGREEWGELLRGADQLSLIAREFQVELAPDDPWVPAMLVPRAV